MTRALIGNGRIQVEGASGYAIEPGYSGAPVWCGQLRSVIGIIAQDEKDASVPAGFVIPSTLLLQVCPADLRERMRGNRQSIMQGSGRYHDMRWNVKYMQHKLRLFLT